jgi:hypothetical protein
MPHGVSHLAKLNLSSFMGKGSTRIKSSDEQDSMIGNNVSRRLCDHDCKSTGSMTLFDFRY